VASFERKIAIVTGGGSGIGRELCKQLAAGGATVVVSDINGESAEVVAAAIDKTGGRATAATLDVTDADAVQALVDTTNSEHGRIDLMFNNAGIAIIGEALDMELADWYRIFDINVRGVVHGVHAVYPIMVKQGSGHIVNTASVAGLAPAPNLTAYAATKHAVVGLSRSLRAEAVFHGVDVSVVCPGVIDTAITHNAKVVNLDRDKLTDLPIKIMSADKCAKEILRGVAKNKPEIVVTAHGRAIYGIQRLAPKIASRLAALQMKRQILHMKTND